jgi:hypothetical protein
MKNSGYLSNLVIGVFLLLSGSCTGKKDAVPVLNNHTRFNPELLIVKDNENIRKVHGQVLYLPIYSNVPYLDHGNVYDLSAFVAIHNTDFHSSIRILKVLYFDNDGKLVSNYLEKEYVLNPLGATNFFVPEKDKSGTGANFIVEWISDSLVSEPLIESVMIGLSGGQGVSFSSLGRVVRELK